MLIYGLCTTKVHCMAYLTSFYGRFTNVNTHWSILFNLISPCWRNIHFIQSLTNHTTNNKAIEERCGQLIEDEASLMCNTLQSLLVDDLNCCIVEVCCFVSTQVFFL